MGRPVSGHLLAALAGLFLALAPAVGYAQFADETQGLFLRDPGQPRTKDHIVIYQFTTVPADEPKEVGAIQAQSVEDLCCSLSAEERAADGLCFEVVCGQGQ